MSQDQFRTWVPSLIERGRQDTMGQVLGEEQQKTRGADQQLMGNLQEEAAHGTSPLCSTR